MSPKGHTLGTDRNGEQTGHTSQMDYVNQDSHLRRVVAPGVMEHNDGKKIGYDILIGISEEDQMNDINPVYQLMRRKGHR